MNFYADSFDFTSFLNQLVAWIDDLVNFIESIITFVSGFFDSIDFTVLWSWMPDDISAAYGVVVSLMLILAIFGIVKRVLMK